MDEPKLKANYKNKSSQAAQTPQEKYQACVEDYKAALHDKTHPKNQTEAYNTNLKAMLNRLLVSADEYDGISPGSGIFGLIILSLRTNLALKDKITELEYEKKQLEQRVKRLEKQ